MDDREVALATLWISRALLLAEPDVWRPEEAADLLDRAEPVIANRDPGKLYALLATRAMLLFRWGSLARARETFERLVEVSAAEDRDVQLDALGNLLWVRIEAEDTSEEVEQSVSQLLHENASRGRLVQVARAKWRTGRLEMLGGRHDAAIAPLHEAMATIEDPEESIRIGMDGVRCLVAAGRHDVAFELARDLAASATALDAREPSRRRALTAEVCAYLRDGARKRVLTSGVIADLAKYLDRIRRRRPTAFVPPMPLADM